MSEPAHRSVLLDEAADVLNLRPGLRVVDGTFGAGGYSRVFLEAGADVLAIDRDPTAKRFAAPLQAEYPDRFRLAQGCFSDVEQHLAAAGWSNCQGLALDLGVSSMQLDEAERGFSFMRDGPLDMRMGDEGPTAADLVNTAEPAELARIFWLYGEERASRHIANVIARRRTEQPFARTADLAETVERALGGRRGAPTHPATRVFQALRIAVNDELGELEAALGAAERVLETGGRLAVVTFHSLEDRIVKAFLTERCGRTPAGSRHLPPKAKGPEPTFLLLLGGVRAPSDIEVFANPRARSAKLRAAERTAAPPMESGGMKAFLRRMRGFRMVEFGALTVMLSLALAVYLVKARAGRETGDITTVEGQIADEQKRIRLLRAEVAHLEQPDRLQRLAEAAGLAPTSGRREAELDHLSDLAHSATLTDSSAAALPAPPTGPGPQPEAPR